MDRSPGAEKAGEIEQLPIDPFLDQQRQGEAAHRERPCLRGAVALKDPLAASRFVDLHHEWIAQRVAGVDEASGRLDDGKPRSRHAGSSECPGEADLRTDMAEVLRTGDGNQPALRGVVDPGIADLPDETVFAGDDKAAGTRLPADRHPDPTPSGLEGHDLPHSP